MLTSALLLWEVIQQKHIRWSTAVDPAQYKLVSAAALLGIPSSHHAPLHTADHQLWIQQCCSSSSLAMEIFIYFVPVLVLRRRKLCFWSLWSLWSNNTHSLLRELIQLRFQYSLDFWYIEMFKSDLKCFVWCWNFGIASRCLSWFWRVKGNACVWVARCILALAEWGINWYCHHFDQFVGKSIKCI